MNVEIIASYENAHKYAEELLEALDYLPPDWCKINAAYLKLKKAMGDSE
jgi:hypothetical protein